MKDRHGCLLPTLRSSGALERVPAAMPSLTDMFAPLDVIEFRVAVDAWEPGTVATVLETGADSVLAEVADDEGRTLAVVTVPLDAAERLEGQSVPKRPEASPSVPAALIRRIHRRDASSRGRQRLHTASARRADHRRFPRRPTAGRLGTLRT